MAGMIHSIRQRMSDVIKPPTNRTPLPNKPRHDYHLHDHGSRGRNFVATAQGRADAAESSITVTRCIDFRINHLKGIRWAIYNSRGKPVENHPFHNMLRYHHAQTSINFFDRWLKMLLIHGNVYMEKLYREDNFLPGGIRIINPLYISPIIEHGELKYYEYVSPNANERTKIPPDLIMWDKLGSAHSDFRGKSPMDRALRPVNIDRKNISTIESYLDNDNKPAAVITLGPNSREYNDEEIKEFRDEWEAQGRGANNGYQTRFLPGDFNIFAFSTQKPDMVYSYEMDSLICREFKIDPALVGVHDQSDGDNSKKFSPMETKWINALTDAVLPDMKHTEEFINEHILPFISPNTPKYKFSWNYDEIFRMIRYSDTSVDQLRSDLQIGAISKDEYREARFFGRLPIGGGNVFTIPKGYVHVSEDEMKDLPILKEIDPKVIQEVMERSASPAFAASASPDFAEINASSERRPGENRYFIDES